MSLELTSYESIHHIYSLDTATEEDLRLIIRSFPVIDNHAHNILQEDHAYGNQDYPFESITSEAQGHALHDHTHTSLAHIQGINQLAELFRCRPTLDDVKAARYEWVQRDYRGLVRNCLQGTHAIMIDDGLAQEAVHPVSWHEEFVPTASRIVRIEFLAAELLEQLVDTAGFTRPGREANWDRNQSESFLVRFNTVFRTQIRTLAQDPRVRGFKSVVCYRTGLDIGLESRNVFRPHQALATSPLLSSFHKFLQQAVRMQNYRIQQKEFNDYLVVATCDVLDKLIDTDGESVPIQFHTGLGDSDIDLIKANPAHMKPLVEIFPNIDFVILHAAYPYTREAGYMASTFANVWLDIGLVFPLLSRDGQELALRHALQLSPTSKILWSTDGHLHPETYYLANRQFRTVLEKILVEYSQAGDLSLPQAINAAVDILFWNSNQLYKLDEERKYPQLLRACGRSNSDSIRTLANSNSIVESFDSSAATISSQLPSPRASTPLALGSVTSTSTMTETLDQAVAMFDAFQKLNPSLKYIWVLNVDFNGTQRQRMIPIAAFRRHISTGKYPGITCALPDLLPNDTFAESATATGEIKMVPDLSSICLNTVIKSPSATVQTWWMDESNGNSPSHYFACPRWALKKHLDILKDEFKLTMLMGIEIEVCFMQPTYTADNSSVTGFLPLSTIHSWSGLTYADLDTLPMIEEIVEALAEVGITLDQFHAEAAPGQWEFPLPAFEPVKAIDTLYKAREIIRWVAHKHGLKATLYPRPYKFTCGSASHAHFSINGLPGEVEKHSGPFLAGILKHLPSILAFSLPIEESYSRVAAGIWAGGEYVCWGTQNREVPLRKCGPGHWELKTVDGIGNMYLSMAALVASGIHGLRENLQLTCKDNLGDASMMSAEKREELGITTLLPKTLEESLNNLDGNKMLREMMGDKLVDGYVALKKFETKFLNGMTEDDRRIWLIARY